MQNLKGFENSPFYNCSGSYIIVVMKLATIQKLTADISLVVIVEINVFSDHCIKQSIDRGFVLLIR